MMAILALLTLLLGSMAGLLTGARLLAAPLAAAGLAGAFATAPEAGALGALGAVGVLAGAHLRQVVAEQGF
jgi:hypothetical protein